MEPPVAVLPDTEVELKQSMETVHSLEEKTDAFRERESGRLTYLVVESLLVEEHRRRYLVECLSSGLPFRFYVQRQNPKLCFEISKVKASDRCKTRRSVRPSDQRDEKRPTLVPSFRLLRSS